MKKKQNNNREGFKKTFYFFVAPVLICILVFSLVRDFSLVNKIENILLKPKAKIYTSVQYLGDLKDAIFNSVSLIDENKKLKEENLLLRALNDNNRQLISQNLRFLDLLNLKASYIFSEKDLAVARVIFKTNSDIYNRLYINKGSEDGIEKEMVVLYGNSLIGKIIEVNRDLAEVLPLSSGKIEVSARVLAKDFLGIVGIDKINNRLFLRLSSSENINKIEIGDKVYTSGIGDIYPEGILIGEVEEIEEKSDKIYLKYEYSMEEIREVLVLKRKSDLKQAINKNITNVEVKEK